jgi:hypothetical protein
MTWKLFLAGVACALSPLPVIAQGHGTLFWAHNTAYLMPAGRVETGALHPVRWGVAESIEISAQPLLFVLSPNADVKLALGSIGRWQAASRHGLHVPTPLLRLVARDGVGGIIPADSRVPALLALSSEVLLTRPVSQQNHLTLRLGGRVALPLGERDMPTIDLPFIYHRSAAYHGVPVVQAGASFTGEVAPKLSYLLDAGLLYAMRTEGRYALETSALLGWRLSRRFALAGGLRSVYGEYPFGLWHRMLPVVDVRWTLSRRA